MLRVKDSLTAFLLIIFLFYEIQEYTCLRIKNFEVPAIATVGTSTFLKCLIDLEKDRLVNLKWYFNDEEFLRFEPKSRREETQIFRLPSLNLEKSNVVNSAEKGSMIRLTDVQKEMSGTYKCEVTIESKFYTTSKESYMDVVLPVITTSTASYPTFHRRPKQPDLDAIEEEKEPPSQGIVNNGCSIITLSWFNIINIVLIIYGLLFVMH